MQRDKGARGERELAAIIRDWLGLDVRRNWQGQAAIGGQDLTGVPGWVIECKRACEPNLREWWRQACEQAEGIGAPALAYRIDGAGRGLEEQDKWQVMCWLSDISELDIHGAIIMSLRTWMDIVREQMQKEAAI